MDEFIHNIDKYYDTTDLTRLFETIPITSYDFTGHQNKQKILNTAIRGLWKLENSTVEESEDKGKESEDEGKESEDEGKESEDEDKESEGGDTESGINVAFKQFLLGLGGVDILLASSDEGDKGEEGEVDEIDQALLASDDEL